ncbi:MAG TPA: DUF1614 domain-containing protein [Streptosporangiaceae bacterium]|nr:DUF1614 domain-containing protein [Streptosporangiaceae bacterium]
MFGYAGRPGLRAAWDSRPDRPARDGGSRRGERRGQQVFYWPLARPFMLAGLVGVAFLVALLQVGVFSYAFARLGISPGIALLLLLASLAGSAVNLPVARLRNQVVEVRRMVTVFGIRYIVPMLTRRNTTIAVNVGGALMPVFVSGYLIAHDRIGWQALAAVVIVGAVVHLVARPVPGLGIAVPALLPGIFAALVAVALHPVAVAGLAYAGGTLGTLLGADLVNLPKVRRLGAPVVSIGGAGTFDGVFITGIIAVLLASLL